MKEPPPKPNKPKGRKRITKKDPKVPALVE
jgi:hypothetical protein